MQWLTREHSLLSVLDFDVSDIIQKFLSWGSRYVLNYTPESNNSWEIDLYCFFSLSWLILRQSSAFDSFWWNLEHPFPFCNRKDQFLVNYWIQEYVFYAFLYPRNKSFWIVPLSLNCRTDNIFFFFFKKSFLNYFFILFFFSYWNMINFLPIEIN